MFKRPLFLLLVLCISCLLAAARAQSGDTRPELRAFWADGFNPAFKTPQETDELLQRLHNTHCNAIFAQMRKGGDAYYRSHYEPWAKDDTDHFDALAYLIEKAHAMNPPIAVHAWINTCAVGGNGKNPYNIVHLHPDWLSLNPNGENFDGEATKIDPGNPDAADWTFRIYLDVARHYNVDGIHFDFVRYGGREWGYNPVSLARFQQRYAGRKGIKRLPGSDLPDPSDESWKQWRRDQVTNLVRKVYAHAVAINPRLVVSAAVITWADAPRTEAEWYTKNAAMNRVYQDWRGWLKEGMIDLACPMTYFQADNHTDWQRHWSETIKNHQYRRAATVGVGTWFNTIPQNLELIEIARKKSGKGRYPYGVMLYSYAGTNASETKDAKGKRIELEYQPDFYAALSQPFTTSETGVGTSSQALPPGATNSSSYVPNSAHSPYNQHPALHTQPPPFPTDAQLPFMPWKTRPRTGHLKGFVLTAGLDAVDGATVTVSGQGRQMKRQTDGTGFYALIDLLPGDYLVKATAPGFTPVQQKATVKAGEVASRLFTLGSASIPLSPSLAALAGPVIANGMPVRVENLTVTLGTDTFPGNLYAMDAEGAGIRIRLSNPPLLPFQPGDVIFVTGLVQKVDGEATIEAARACLTDIRPMSELPAVRPLTGKDLKSNSLPIGLSVEMKGSVVASNSAGFALDVEGYHVEVPLAGHKGFEVEAADLSARSPVVGTEIAATGILSRAIPERGAPFYRLNLAGSDAIHVLPGTAFWRKPWAPVVALCIFRSPDLLSRL